MIEIKLKQKGEKIQAEMTDNVHTATVEIEFEDCDSASKFFDDYTTKLRETA